MNGINIFRTFFYQMIFNIYENLAISSLVLQMINIIKSFFIAKERMTFQMQIFEHKKF
jgi:hypothetical protein